MLQNGAVGGIDHVVIVVSDLSAAARAYQRLGFQVSTRASHSAEMGTANHTIVLQNDYLELLGIAAPTRSNQRWYNALQWGEGIGGLALQTSSASDARKTWQAAGFSPSEVRYFSRIVERTGRAPVEARFEVVSLPSDAIPGVSLFVCSHLTPEAVWLPEMTAHPNTAQAIRRVTISVPSLSVAAGVWRQVLPTSTQEEIEGGVRIRALNHLIDLIDKGEAVKRYGPDKSFGQARALEIEFVVSDVAACRATLLERRVTTQIRGDDTSVSATDGCGVAITMVPHRTALPVPPRA